ncbi:MAG: class I tRNA ligase family protein, partial [Promethearchaeota archaeon]|jgi:valyl-tRNA synthetase
MIRNEKGRKISKSMENVDQYDPLMIIEKFGADTLRYVLISNGVPGLDMNLDPRNLDATHKFCNKIWQASRYVLSNIQENEEIPNLEFIDPKSLSYPDRWILSRLNSLIQSIQSHIDNYDYLQWAREVKTFFWNEFCDWYIEMSKIYLYDEDYTEKQVQKSILIYILDTCFRLLHPIIPFITEKLWQALPDNIKDVPTIMYAKWPERNEKFINVELDESFIIMSDFIREIRRVKHDFGIPLKTRVPLQIQTEKTELFDLIRYDFIKMAFIDEAKFIIKKNIEIPPQSVRIVLHGILAFIPLAGMIDIAKERSRIQNSLDKTNLEKANLSKKLESQFSERAPKELVEKERQRLEELNIKIEQFEDQLKYLK